MKTYRQKEIIENSDVKFINLFFLGIIVYSFGAGLSDTGYIHPIICSLIQIVGILMFVPGSFFLINFNINQLYLKVVYYVYLVYLISVVFRGFSLDFGFLKVTLFDQWFGVFIYFSPLIMLIPITEEYLRRLLQAIKLFAALFLFFVLITIPYIMVSGSHEGMRAVEYYSRTFGITSGIILITFPFHSRRTNFLSLGSMFTALMISVYHGRRGLAIYCFLILVIASIVYLKKGSFRSILVVVGMMIFSSLLTLGLDRISNSGLLANLTKRGLEDTRSNVEANFYEDMQPIDWIIGRGMSGEYYCPGIIWGDGEPSVYRSVIETDFLQMILKGGFVSLGLLMLILIPAAILGIFKSRNLFTLSCGIWILLGVINMYPSSVNTFTLNYMLIWVCVRICFSKSLRNLNNHQIMKILNPKKPKETFNQLTNV
ncbi:hypothetical protein QWZ00_11850 [Belliella kenyensis]|uniref:hypothetical protein n=1 Tax=Belliella kenyensis TaxID=1472724 RepID=UPI0025B3738B|nr:hypothetical protein [Belliella kenyensis]MDN3603808.1 hypothetical protein [Belliella kenyensis]